MGVTHTSLEPINYVNETLSKNHYLAKEKVRFLLTRPLKDKYPNTPIFSLK